jgi:hypothetical protein
VKYMDVRKQPPLLFIGKCLKLEKTEALANIGMDGAKH